MHKTKWPNDECQKKKKLKNNRRIKREKKNYVCKATAHNEWKWTRYRKPREEEKEEERWKESFCITVLRVCAFFFFFFFSPMYAVVCVCVFFSVIDFDSVVCSRRMPACLPVCQCICIFVDFFFLCLFLCIHRTNHLVQIFFLSVLLFIGKTVARA